MKGNAQKKEGGLVLEFASAVLKSLPEMKEAAMRHWISRQGRRGLLAKRLCEALGGDVGLDIQLQEMVRFYQEVFGLELDVSSVALPVEREGFGWLLLAPAEMTLNRAFAKCKERFPSASYVGDDLNKGVPTNERDPAKIGAYAIRLRDRVEADEEWKETSADTIASRRVTTITLLERVLLELWYHWKTGKHLDVNNWTLCSGSRDADGYVPSADWSDGRFRVGWRGPDDAAGDLRAREAAVSQAA